MTVGIINPNVEIDTKTINI